MGSFSSDYDLERSSAKEVYSGDETLSKSIRTQAVVANPAPLALMASALTTFVLSCQNAGILIPPSASHSIVIGLALSYGGLAQLLAGMWEFSAGNTFGATVFSSYAAFWFSFAVIEVPGFGVRAAFVASGSSAEFHNALGIWLLGWTIFTFLVWLATLRTNFCLTSLFVSLLATLILLTIGELNLNKTAMRAGGLMGILTALIAWYLGLAEIVNKQNSFFELPIGKFTSSRAIAAPREKDFQMESRNSRIFTPRSRSFKE